MAIHPNQKLAVLIDADNARASVAKELLAEVSRYGIHHQAHLWRLDDEHPE